MSPFALQLKKIRIARKLQQRDMAHIVGCEPSYISSLETDAKPPPQQDKLNLFFRKMDFTPEEQASLLKAAKQSRRFIKLPLRGKTQIFEVSHALEDQFPTISDLQLELIALVLRLNPKEMGVPKM